MLETTVQRFDSIEIFFRSSLRLLSGFIFLNDLIEILLICPDDSGTWKNLTKNLILAILTSFYGVSLSSTPPQFNTENPSIQHTSQFNTKNPQFYHLSVQHQKAFSSTPKTSQFNKLFWCWTEACVELRGFRCWTEEFLVFKWGFLVLKWGVMCGTEGYSIIWLSAISFSTEITLLHS